MNCRGRPLIDRQRSMNDVESEQPRQTMTAE